jgi:hypothetical protein
MGLSALRFFEEAGKSGGLVGKMRLASTARLTSTEAASLPDSPELLLRLEQALGSLRGDTPAKVSAEGSIVPPTAGPDRTLTLHRHLQTYVELMTQRSLFLGDVAATVRRIDEAACAAIDVERVSVWFLDDEHTRITCADLYARGSGEHASGTELFARDFAPYFDALRSERTIAAHDAHADPRTSCFSEVYLAPLGITSMLDVPIWVAEKMVGVICHEHVGAPRRWNSDEETFGYLMANFVALALERSEAANASSRASEPPR